MIITKCRRIRFRLFIEMVEMGLDLLVQGDVDVQPHEECRFER